MTEDSYKRDIKDGEVICIVMSNSTTIIGRYAAVTAGVRDAFYVSLIRNPESKERNFFFKPILPYSEHQYLCGTDIQNLINAGVVMTMHEPVKEALEAYSLFISDECTLSQVLSSYSTECGPSKEFIESLMGGEPKPEPCVTGNVITGVFCPKFEKI
jgi:hypothetical protein